MLWLLNNKLERMWKDAVMAYFDVLSEHLSEGTGKNPENSSLDSLCPERGSSAWRSFIILANLCSMLCLRQSVLRVWRITERGWFISYSRKTSSFEEQGTSIWRKQEVSLFNSQHKSYLTDVPFEASGNLEFVSLFKEDRISSNNSLDSIVSKLPCWNIDAAGERKIKIFVYQWL
jgi:hypothetical protein